MFKTRKLFTALALVLVVILMTTPVALAQTAVGVSAMPDNNGRGGRLHIQGTLVIHNITVEEVWAFTSNLENDDVWYPGTFDATLVSGDGGRGSVYTETVCFGGGCVSITATILQYVPNNKLRFMSDGILINETQYTYHQNPDGSVRFNVDSFVEAPAGVTQTDLENFLAFAFTLLLGALGRTGEISFH
jgi:hypothetical protein